MLNCSDLYSGLKWLGVEMTVEQMHTLMRRIDSDNDGLLDFVDFKRAFTTDGKGGINEEDSEEEGDEEDDGEGDGMKRLMGGFMSEEFPRFEIPELFADDSGNTRGAELSATTFTKFNVKIHQHKHFTEVWNTQGTMSRTKASIWAPNLMKAGAKRDRLRVR